MNDGLKVFVLESGLFPDAVTLGSALSLAQHDHTIERFDASRSGLTEADWDRALGHLLAADRIIVV